MITFLWDYGRKNIDKVNKDFLQAIKNRFEIILRRRTERSIIEINPLGFESIVGSILSVQEIERAEVEKLNRASRRALKKNRGNKKHR